MRNLTDLAEALMPIVAQAGNAIMRFYDGAFTVQRKDDNSPLTLAPLTLADLESQRLPRGLCIGVRPARAPSPGIAARHRPVFA